MGNRRRPHNQRHLRGQRRTLPARGGYKPPKPGAGESYAHQPAVASSSEHVSEARTASHDSLIGQLGNRRRSGVWWTHHEGTEALACLAELYAGDLSARERAGVAQLRSALIEHEAPVLVVAWALGAVPEGSAL